MRNGMMVRMRLAKSERSHVIGVCVKSGAVCSGNEQLQDGDECIPSLYNRFRQLRQAMGDRLHQCSLIGDASLCRRHRLS